MLPQAFSIVLNLKKVLSKYVLNEWILIQISLLSTWGDWEWLWGYSSWLTVLPGLLQGTKHLRTAGQIEQQIGTWLCMMKCISPHPPYTNPTIFSLCDLMQRNGSQNDCFNFYPPKILPHTFTLLLSPLSQSIAVSPIGFTMTNNWSCDYIWDSASGRTQLIPHSNPKEPGAAWMLRPCLLQVPLQGSFWMPLNLHGLPHCEECGTLSLSGKQHTLRAINMKGACVICKSKNHSQII